MLKRRNPRLGLVAGLVACLAIAGTVSASGSTSVLNVWGTMGVWGTYTNFTAQWQASKMTSEGQTYWHVQKFGMDAVVLNGKACTSDICTAWSFNSNAKFLNSAGQQVTSLAPPIGNCYTAAYSSSDRYFSRCGWTSGNDLPLTVTQVKLTWTVSVQRRDGIWVNAWSATKTVPFK